MGQGGSPGSIFGSERRRHRIAEGQLAGVEEFGWTRLSLHPELFEVELVDDGAKGLVVDLAAVAEVDDGGALGVDDAELDRLVLLALLAALGGLGLVVGREVAGPVLEA